MIIEIVVYIEEEGQWRDYRTGAKTVGELRGELGIAKRRVSRVDGIKRDDTYPISELSAISFMKE